MIEAAQPLDLQQLSDKVDQLGLINARIAALEAEAESLKADLKAASLEQIHGQLFKAVVKISSRNTLDKEKLLQHLSAKKLALCYKTSTSTSLTVYGL